MIINLHINPDVIINHVDLTLNISGDAYMGLNWMENNYIGQMTGTYSNYSMTNYYGDINMDYIATWEIMEVKKNKIKNILQSGRYVSKYYNPYSYYEELMTSAKKVGKEFSSLITDVKL